MSSYPASSKASTYCARGRSTRGKPRAASVPPAAAMAMVPKARRPLGVLGLLRRRSVGRSVVACGRRHPGRNHRRFTADTAGAGCRHPALHRAVGGAGCRLHSEARGKHHPLACARYFTKHTARGFCSPVAAARRALPRVFTKGPLRHADVCGKWPSDLTVSRKVPCCA